jgi:hypothetical protein
LVYLPQEKYSVKKKRMKIKVQRLHDTGDATVGAMFIDGVFQCFTLEDEHRDVKIKGETRIPAGTYKINFRKEGGFHAKYTAKYGSMHKGMLHVQDVPNFQWILIHTGNTDEHTAGCLLVGETADLSGVIGRSVDAYKKMYPKVAKALEDGKEVTIQYLDEA